MSLRKILTGNPRNIKEVADMAFERNLPVNVAFRTFVTPAQTWHDITQGRTIYSIGSRVEEIVRTNKVLIRKLDYLRSIKTLPILEDASLNLVQLKRDSAEVIKRLQKNEKPNLDYLTSRGVNYITFELATV